MFPIPWNFPFRKKNGDVTTLDAAISSGGGGGGGYELPTATANRLGGVKIGNGVNVASDGKISVSSYELPKASAETLGGVKIGSGVNIDSNGVISVSGGGGGYTLPTASASTKGGVKIGSGLTMTGEVLSNDNPTPYSLPTASANTLGGVKIGSGVSIDANGVISVSGGSGGGGMTLTPISTSVIAPTGTTRLALDTSEHDGYAVAMKCDNTATGNILESFPELHVYLFDDYTPVSSGVQQTNIVSVVGIDSNDYPYILYRKLAYYPAGQGGSYNYPLLSIGRARKLSFSSGSNPAMSEVTTEGNILGVYYVDL